MRVWNPVTGQMEEVPELDYGSGVPDLTQGTAPQLNLGGFGEKVKDFAVGAAPTVLGMFGPGLGAIASKVIDERQEGLAGRERDKQREAEANKALGLNPQGTAPSGDIPGVALAAPPAPPIPSTITSTTRVKEAPGEKEAREGIKEQAEKGARATEEQGRIKEKVNESQAELLREKEAAGIVQAGRVDRATDEESEKVQRARDVYKSEQDKYSKMEIKDYYDGHTGRKIADAISAGLGELGAVLAKTGHNTALDIIRGKQADWYAQEKAKIEKQFKTAGMAKDQLTEAESAKRDRLSDLAMSFAARQSVLADKIEAAGKEAGTGFALKESERQAAAIRGDASKVILDDLKGLRTQVHTAPNPAAVGGGRGGGQPTESQGKLAFLAQQMKGDLDTIIKNPALSQKGLEQMQRNQLAGEAADKTATGGLLGNLAVAGGRALGAIPKSKYQGLSDNDQLVANAWDNALEKYVRLLTGAGMPADEARRMGDQNAPRPGETPVMMAQKFRRLEAATEQMMSLAGKAAGMIAPAAQGTTVPAASGGGARPGKVNGKPALIYPDGHYELVQ
jgi:hypothetical protein